jgi:hypothetical protein
MAASNRHVLLCCCCCLDLEGVEQISYVKLARADPSHASGTETSFGAAGQLS